MMTGVYTICKAQESDMTEILRLQHIVYQSEAILYNNYSIEPLTQTLEQATAEYHTCVVLKAVLDGQMIGSVRAYEKGGDVYIGKLMVLPGYQNRGIGKNLLQAIENEFKGKRFELFTGAKSEKNLALYEKCGYVRFKTEQATPGPTFVYMEKTPGCNNCKLKIQPITPETRKAVTDFFGQISKYYLNKSTNNLLTYKFTGDTSVLHKRFIEREKTPERGQENTMFYEPSAEDSINGAIILTHLMAAEI